MTLLPHGAGARHGGCADILLAPAIPCARAGANRVAAGGALDYTARWCGCDLRPISERGVVQRLEGVPDVPRPVDIFTAGSQLSGGAPRLAGLPPRLGQHSDRILRDMGDTDEPIVQWREAGVICVPLPGAGMQGSNRTGRVLGLGGVFFRSRDPKALSAWYVAWLGMPEAAGRTMLAPADMLPGASRSGVPCGRRRTILHRANRIS